MKATISPCFYAHLKWQSLYGTAAQKREDKYGLLPTGGREVSKSIKKTKPLFDDPEKALNGPKLTQKMVGNMSRYP